MSYRNHYSTRQTPQSRPIPGKPMAQNAAGGHVFTVTDWDRLDRFLILGSEGGTYYSNERELTVGNAEAVARCIKSDGPRTVARIVEISTAGRAPKNDPALFALAMCAGTGMGDLKTRRAALDALPQVARIGTHLFHFLEYVEGFRGWGRALRRAVASWYNDMPVSKLAYQVVKYQQRDGWSHRDALRLAHPVADEGTARNDLYRWIVGKDVKWHSAYSMAIPWAYGYLKKNPTVQNALTYIDNCGLTREMIPTSLLNDSRVWSALLHKMPLTAMVRNLGKMTSIGLLKPMCVETDMVCNRLRNGDYIRKSRLHPLAILVALRVYGQGHGVRGSLKWEPVREIIDALDEAFYLAFDNVEATGQRTMLALDVSGSMSYGKIASSMPITPREASAAMAMITARTETQWMTMGFSDNFVPLAISPRQRLDDVIKSISDLPFQSTDCALPMLYAIERGLEIDVFVIYTDSETWAGDIHPTQALRLYREKTGIDAKLVVVGMTTTEFSIADPDDSGMMDVIGFDTAAPQLIADFSRDG